MLAERVDAYSPMPDKQAQLLEGLSLADDPIEFVRVENKEGRLPLPGSVGIIADGNGRWAAKQEPKVKVTEGHKKGAEQIAALLRACRKLEPIHTVAVWAMSPDNMVKRDEEEIAGLMDLAAGYTRSLLPELRAAKARFVHLGRKEGLPTHVAGALKYAEWVTSGNTGQTIALAFNYDGTTHGADRLQYVYEAAMSGELKKPSYDDFRRIFNQGQIEPLDMMIRTGINTKHSMHTSDIGWIAGRAQWHGTPTLMPELDERELATMFINDAFIQKRHGGRPENARQ